jgi:hypothetical protein
MAATVDALHWAAATDGQVKIFSVSSYSPQRGHPGSVLW